MFAAAIVVIGLCSAKDALADDDTRRVEINIVVDAPPDQKVFASRVTTVPEVAGVEGFVKRKYIQLCAATCRASLAPGLYLLGLGPGPTRVRTAGDYLDVRDQPMHVELSNTDRTWLRVMLATLAIASLGVGLGGVFWMADDNVSYDKVGVVIAGAGFAGLMGILAIVFNRDGVELKQ